MFQTIKRSRKRLRVIGFCGLPGSGKSTAIDAIKDLGIVVTMGDVVRKEAKKRKIAPNDENLGKIARELRKEGGSEIIAKKCVKFIMNLKDNNVFLDGVRSWDEVKVFRKLWEFPLIAIQIDENFRFKRISERGRSDDSKMIEELRKRDERELNFGLEEVINRADYKIVNESSIDDLKKKTRDLILQLIQQTKNYTFK